MSGSHTGVQTFEASGFHWRVQEPLGAALLRDLIPWLDGPEGGPLRTLKSARRRQVHQALIPGLPPLVLKHYPPRTGFPEALRDFIATRAQVEFERGQQLASAGLPCPTPLAWAEGQGPQHARESWLVSVAILGAQALGPYLEARYRPGDQDPGKLGLVRRAVRLAADLHDAGFLHRDLHGGNLLLREAEGPGGVLHLIDCARTWSLGVVPAAWRARELAHLFHSLRHVLDRGETRRLQEEAAVDGLSLDLLGPALRRAERRADRSRTSRALVPCSRYAHERKEGGLVIRDRKLPAAAVPALLEGHRLVASRGDPDLLRLGSRSRLSQVPDPTFGSVIVKEFPVGAGSPASRARRSWVGGVALRARDIPTPLPLALVTDATGPGFVVMARAGEAAPLHFLQTRDPPPDPDRMLDALADLLIRLFTRELVHGDLSPKNLLWDPHEADAPVQLVDWDAVRPRARWNHRRRVRALVQVSDLPGPELGAARWRSFLHAVLEGAGAAQDVDRVEEEWRAQRRRRQRKHAERSS